MKRKKRVKRILSIVLPVVIFFAIVAGAVILVVFRNTTKLSGFDKWDPEGSDILDEHLVEQSFLTEYPYRDGGFHYYRRKAFLFSFWGGIPAFGVDTKAERSFVWLTYDDPAVYEAAKQSRFDAASTKLYPFEDPDVYGFRFYYVGENATFPANFSVFGYNDEKRTLVFVGATRDRWEKEDPHVVAGLTDFAGFLDWFFGDWFDWSAGDRAPD